AVVNLGSSMVFDFAIFDKPCMFLKYNVEHKIDESWNPEKVYDFVHFRSMPTGEEVFWIKEKKHLLDQFVHTLGGGKEKVEKAKIWFEKINQQPPQGASKRIWEGIEDNIKKENFSQIQKC